LAKQADPSRLSDRAKRDEQLKPEIKRVFEENFKVYGVRKVWQQPRREDKDIARCTVERLVKVMGLHCPSRQNCSAIRLPVNGCAWQTGHHEALLMAWMPPPTGNVMCHCGVSESITQRESIHVRS